MLRTVTDIHAAAARSRLFWRARRPWLLLVFVVRRWVYRTRLTAAAARDEAGILGQFLIGTGATLVLASAVAGALQFLVGPWLSIPAPFSHVNAGYPAVLQTVASITGVFLALHFGATTSVAGSTYGDVPSCVRDFYVAEKLGSAYVRLLLFVTSLALALLALDAFGLPRLPASLMLITPLAVTAMVAFTHLVRYHFRLLDPTALASQVLHSLHRCTMSATHKGFAWSDPSFQQHNHDRALNDLRVLDALADLSLSARVDLSSCARLAEQIVTALHMYGLQKHAIPPDSRWFARQAQYANWYTTNAIDLDLADSLGSGLRPNASPDARWYEKRLLAILHRMMAERLCQDPALAAGVLNRLRACARFYSSNLDSAAMADALLALLGAAMHASTGNTAMLQVEALALTEGACLVSIDALIGFIQTATNVNAFDFDASISACLSKSHRRLYQSRRPPSMQRHLQTLRNKLTFERSVYRRVITPTWFIRQDVGAAVHRDVAEAARIAIQSCQWLCDRVADAIARSQPAHAAIIASRGIEQVTRLRQEIPILTEVISATLEPKVNSSDYVVVDLPWAQHETTLERHLTALELSTAQLVQPLSLLEFANGLPDLLGEAVHRTGMAILRKLEAGTHQPLAQLFDAYFDGALISIERLKSSLATVDAERRALASLDPLFDLLAVSGLARAWSELLHNPNLWEPIEKRWSLFFATQSVERLAYIAAALKLKRTSLFMLSRDPTRHEWMRSFLRAVSRLPTEHGSVRTFYADNVQVKHASRLVRALGRHSGASLIDAIEVFAVCYLQPMANGTHSFSWSSLARELAAEGETPQ